MHNPNPDTLQQQMTLSGDTLDSCGGGIGLFFKNKFLTQNFGEKK